MGENLQCSMEECGPLFQLSELMNDLPAVKSRGLSRFYKGKSQSFASLADVRVGQDLSKKEIKSQYRRIKWCSISDKLMMGPKPIIKKTKKGHLLPCNNIRS